MKLQLLLIRAPALLLTALGLTCVCIALVFIMALHINVKPMALHMAEKRQKTATLNLRINPALKEAAERAAAADHRSLTSFVEKLLSDYVASQPSKKR